MDTWFELLIDLVIILIFMGGFRQFRFPKGARRGNMTAAFALALAMAVVILRHKILEPELVIIALLLGSVLGWTIAMRVNMIQIPAMVAFQHGAGGIAAFLVSFVELARIANPGLTVDKVSGLLGLVIGAATFSGSLIAGGKLANVIKQPPILLPKHSWLVIGLIILITLSGFVTGNAQGQALIYYLLLLIALSVLLGLVFSIRIGGADMPVLISFLNATAGLAAAFCGVIIQNRLLIACGATVAASGSILTYVMCRAMNRNLLKVFLGFQAKAAFDWTQSIVMDKEEPEKTISPRDQEAQTDPLAEAIAVSKNAETIIMIPGYGMALAQAQFKVVELVNLLEQSGKQVKFAIHPVAGRMPGHMNVLLAEAEVPYDKL
ncbi:MAG: NAD(P)(+) transhydrogenase (Re/Si-specific) subunit beta, partial [Anaerolineae bacterium]|nr:NAD(P)(+) transhydrogenase (Re/Si-specific) subunit beta [Anaerolineae bacterium]